jgi:hypothetical protein
MISIYSPWSVCRSGFMVVLACPCPACPSPAVCPVNPPKCGYQAPLPCFSTLRGEVSITEGT